MTKHKLLETELTDLRAIHDTIKKAHWQLSLVKENTAFVHQGQDWAKTQEGIIKLLENAREEYIRQVCVRLKVEGKVSIDLDKNELWTQK